MSVLGPTGEAVGDLPMVGEKVTMTLATADKNAAVVAPEEGQFSNINLQYDGEGNTRDGSNVVDGNGVADYLESPGPGSRTKKRRQPWMIVAAILLVLVSLGLIIGLSIGLSRTSSRRDVNQLSEDNNINLRRNAVNFLVESNIVSASVLNDATTPQARALESILQSPTSIVTIPSLDSNTETEEERNVFIERWAALVFFYSTGGPETWTFRWNVGDVNRRTCDWRAVARVGGSTISGGFTCGSDRTHIVALQIPRTNLTGTIPTEIGLLSRLVGVALNRNNIQGTIPSELQNAVRMREFILDYNQISGTIPTWIDKWSNLNVFTLSRNVFERSIPSEIRSLRNLQLLALDDNLLTGTLGFLDSLSQLRELYLEDNRFVDELQPFALLQRLRFLDVSNNKLVGTIPPSFLDHPQLRILDLHGNLLDGTLPANIPPNNILRLLALQRNIGLKGELPPSLSNLSALSHLDVTSTSFTGKMPTFLGDLTRLQYLFMADTAFEQGPIPNEYRNLTILRDLSLKNSDRTGVLPSWLGGLDRLILLDLDANRLNGTIPTEIGNMASLRLLLLNRNELSGSIPDELSRLTNVILALFDHNKLTGNATVACRGISSPRSVVVSSDCNATASGPGDFVVTCPCCTLCCASSDDSCNDEDHLGELDPIWEDNYQRRGYTGKDFNITR